jgi:hypothetical protein
MGRQKSCSSVGSLNSSLLQALSDRLLMSVNNFVQSFHQAYNAELCTAGNLIDVSASSFEGGESKSGFTQRFAWDRSELHARTANLWFLLNHKHSSPVL